MPRLLCYGLKRNRHAMRRLLFFVAFCLLVIAPAQSSSVQAQCAQGGSGRCGPNCGSYFNIAYDSFFEQTGCAKWNFGSATERAYGIFWGATTHFGRFNGPSGWRPIKQTTMTQPAAYFHDGFSFRYEVQINDPMNDPSTRLDVWIVEPNGNYYLVDRITGPQDQQSRSFNLGEHSLWPGQNLGIEFWAYQPGNSTISIDNLGLWQGPP